jgi:stringent starvation protein B
MSLENSELSFSSNFEGVSYSIILPAHHNNSLKHTYISNPAATSGKR